MLQERESGSLMKKAETSYGWDVRSAWAESKVSLGKMTREERVETLVSAGILELSGEVAEPYRGVIVGPGRN